MFTNIDITVYKLNLVRHLIIPIGIALFTRKVDLLTYFETFLTNMFYYQHFLEIILGLFNSV